MKILFVVEHFYPYVGGAEELFLNLTVSLAECGHDVSVVTTLHDKSLEKFEVIEGVKITRVNCHNRFLFTLFSLPEILRQGKNVDCIHTTSYNSAIPAFFGGLLLKKKVIITFHEVWDKLWFQLPFTSKWKLTAYYLYEWMILKLPFYKYIAVSEFTKKSLINKGIQENKIVQIYNGLNYSKFESFKHEPPAIFTYCFFGRLGISKGLEVALEATKIFCSRYPESRFKLIIPTYPGNLFDHIIHLIHAMDINKNIQLFHNLSKTELLKEVSTSSCVIIPSYSEGFCFVAVESVALGVPVISSGKGALNEVIGGNYLTLENLNAQALVNELEKARLKQWQVTTPIQFHLENSIKEYLTLYKQLV